GGCGPGVARGRSVFLRGRRSRGLLRRGGLRGVRGADGRRRRRRRRRELRERHRGVVSVGVVYHALGGGHGHVMRGLADLARLGGGTRVGPARLRSWATVLGVAYLSPPDGHEAEWVRGQPSPDLLIADVFPRGVVGELAPWLGRVPAWLVARRVEP